MTIREIKIADAENLINLIKEVEATSNYMLMEAGERNTTAEQFAKHIERIEKQSNSTILVAEEDSELIGYMMLVGGSTNKNKHSAYIAIGIVESLRGKGIGTALFNYAEQWAQRNGISRLELTTIIENKAGVALYKKQGFEVEGIKRNSLKINGEFVDEYYMSKLL
ncbi:GNAT family N-acetyltransferase [Ureibacillus manganicus]|uniref:GCN5 family acetyltransferase n=1 Tax=Ureibacillus manganicus DSM 26584 TaxID=1384049 RepID=A0A0A3HY55_9BACL|nr:GNAT family N-acetyltransferase [Ureibacillus manganicus]KGR77369.1 GCN5 family acetyltransferase [Ureibacillus manganicus DSM 26584]